MTSEFRVPAPLQNTIDNLAFLASTEDGEKLFFKERLHINSTDWSARVRRYYFNETLEGQKKIIKEIIDLGLDSLKSYKQNVHYERLVTEFKKAKDGLSNLRNTYLKEKREVQDLDNYIYIMENQIQALDNKTETESSSSYLQGNGDPDETIIMDQPRSRGNTVVQNTTKIEPPMYNTVQVQHGFSPQQYYLNNCTNGGNMIGENNDMINASDNTSENNDIINAGDNTSENNETVNTGDNSNPDSCVLNMNGVSPQPFIAGSHEPKDTNYVDKKMHHVGNRNIRNMKTKAIPISKRPELEEYMNNARNN